MHLLLVMILFVGPAFLSPGSKPVDVPLLTFIPVITTDEQVSGGGNPKGGPPPRALPTPTPPAPSPPAVQNPPPAVQQSPKVPPQPAPNNMSVELNTKPQQRKPNISTTIVRRSTTSNTASKVQAEADARAEERRRLAAVSKAISGIQSGLSESTSIELQGPGGGGLPYANWLQAVKKCYTDAWIISDSIEDESATATASITIARDGSVISARITRRSGNATVDQTVQMTLDRVTRAPALPDNAKEDQRTVTINFNVKAKLLG
jgi:periplasmic protein TonB